MSEKITYSKCGEYYIPNLTVPQEEYQIGKYGNLRKRFLKEYHYPFYSAMLIKGTLLKYLAEIDETCHNCMSDIISKMTEQEGVTEQLKTTNQMEWVRRMNSIR